MFCKANGFLKILTELVFWLVEDFLLYPCYSLVDRRLNIFCFFLICLENLLAGLLVSKGELQSGSAILMFEEGGPSFHALGCSTFSTQSLREHVCSIWKAPAAPHWRYSVFCLFFFLQYWQISFGILSRLGITTWRMSVSFANLAIYWTVIVFCILFFSHGGYKLDANNC